MAPAATARATTPSGSDTSSRNDWLAPPPFAEATNPISGYSSASISTLSPSATSACPTRPSSITIGSPRGEAPNAAT